MPVPRVYRTSGEGAIANYDAFDFATGIAYKDFYGLIASGGLVSSGALVTTPMFSDKIDTVSASGYPVGHNGRLKFTGVFKDPAIINGKAYIQVPMGISTEGGGQTKTYASCAIIHKQNGVETTLGNAKTTNFHCPTTGAAATNKAFVHCCSIDLGRFKIRNGDEIILIIDHQCTQTSSDGYIAIAHDPAGRTPSNANTTGAITWANGALSQLILSIPFVPDL